MVAELSPKPAPVNRTLRATDTVGADGTNWESRSLNRLDGLPDCVRIRFTHIKWRDRVDADLFLVLLADGTIGMTVPFLRRQFRIGLYDPFVFDGSFGAYILNPCRITAGLGVNATGRHKRPDQY